jgi:hypothetical protein
MMDDENEDDVIDAVEPEDEDVAENEEEERM